MTATVPPQPPYKQLRRPTTDRMVAGVASGLGRYFDVDPTLVRVIFAVAGLLTGGLALLAYPIMWFLMPEEPAGAPAWPRPTGTAPQPPPAGPFPPAGPIAPVPPTGQVPPTAPVPPAGPQPPTAA
ncbi:PspC domain-containing protein [Micromonospora globbae]|uniref:PspC domain-containing protein n=1 Tax=Micromonospora globbae TaxID=1894969 RepID=A0A420F0V1_9ACTN|nr:PspC domain-containing protein [Micromonospora globbae]RKF26570.1 PspC domain-containing protein [Micromonospora globbae]